MLSFEENLYLHFDLLQLCMSTSNLKLAMTICVIHNHNLDEMILDSIQLPELCLGLEVP
jgi:hypothetical protein